MKHWDYEASIDWLKARMEVLTATEAVSLIPASDRKSSKTMMLERKVGDKTYQYNPACAKLWAEKTSVQDFNVEAPSEDAARGHVLEPYAVEEFNERVGCEMHHWDDVIIVNDNGLGYSPDAMDIKQPTGLLGGFWPASALVEEMTVKKVLEIKCYGAEHHIMSMLEDRMVKPERLQVAAAMEVIPTLETAAVVFYNPNSQMPMHASTYSRDELEEERGKILQVLDRYMQTKRMLEAIRDDEEMAEWMTVKYTEDEIYRRHCQQPEGLKI